MPASRGKPDRAATVLEPKSSMPLWGCIVPVLVVCTLGWVTEYDGDLLMGVPLLVVAGALGALGWAVSNATRGPRLDDGGVWESHFYGWRYYPADCVEWVDVIKRESDDGTHDYIVRLRRHRGRPVVVFTGVRRGEAETKAAEVGERLRKPARRL